MACEYMHWNRFHQPCRASEEFDDLAGADIESTLRNAWKQLRYEKPDLALTIEEKNDVYRYIYEVPHDAVLQEWFDTTFIVSDTSDGEEFYAQGSRVFKQIKLHYLRKSSELVILAHHVVLYSIGLEILQRTRKPKTYIPREEAIERANAMLTNDYIARLPAIRLRSKIGKTAPGGCRHTEKSFSPETTSAIVAACKKQGISHGDPSSNVTRYTAPADFNLRPYLAAPHNEIAVANYFAPYPFTTDLPATLGELAKTLNDYYNASVPTDAQVSSLSIIERYLQRENGDVVVGEDFSLRWILFREQLRMVYSLHEG
ncbi:uncharacterized protein BDV17DRAFT_280860 [Aspergillus undulatus]|uniref:uncharacterized protein n=1 Tax=Aspergillus undulatus TaxID=1810928 RepID=UPI003CCCD09D